MTTRVLILVGTKKGAFILESTAERTAWALRGPFCDGWPIYHVIHDAATDALYAAGGSPWYGPAVWTSRDLGETWTHASVGLTYGPAGPEITTVWHLAAAHGALYAGVDPAGLFRSADGGQTWTHLCGLRAHPSCPAWERGAGGLCLHSLVAHPTDPQQLWVGISAVGILYTADGGATWALRNTGLRADFLPDPLPAFGFCVHKLVMAPQRPEYLYQQNHCGVYRSADGGRTWDEITAGLPSDFGFAMVTHPRDPRTSYVVPLRAGAVMPDARMAAWRSRDAGATWTRLVAGLPAQQAQVGVLREGLAVDTLERAGVYFGTSAGQVFSSADEGDSWRQVAEMLPYVWSVETAVIGG